MSTDKFVRNSIMESVFDLGNVHLLKGSWNSFFIQQFSGFGGSGTHDDCVDAVGLVYRYGLKRMKLSAIDRKLLGL